MAGTVSFSMKDHSREMLEQMTAQVEKALEMCGMTAENYAKHLCPVDQGRLRNSIAHTVDEENGAYIAMIGSAVEYAPYVELGTGQYYPGGRPTPWIYQDDKGNWHKTSGNKPQPYMKPAIADHVSQYKGIIERTLKGEL